MAAPAEPTANKDELLWLIAFRDDVYLTATPELACLANHNVDVAREERTGVAENTTKTRAQRAHKQQHIHQRAHNTQQHIHTTRLSKYDMTGI